MICEFYVLGRFGSTFAPLPPPSMELEDFAILAPSPVHFSESHRTSQAGVEYLVQ